MKILASPIALRLSIFLALSFAAILSVRIAVNERPIPEMRHTKKLISPLNIQIVPTSPLPESSGDKYSLKAVVSTNADTRDVEIKWNIPNSSALISGEQTIYLRDLKAGEKREFEILIEQLTEENSQIHAVVHGKNDQSNFGFSAQFNSLDQADIDRSLSSLKERAKDYEKDLDSSASN